MEMKMLDIEVSPFALAMSIHHAGSERRM